MLASLLVCAALLAQTPTPVQTKPRPAYDPDAPRAAVQYLPSQRPIQNWHRFNGATRCEQTDNQLSCDNGYRVTVR